MKIIKNRIIQILAVMILLVVGIFSVNHFASPVMASDELTKGEFNAKMEEIENEFAELKTIIEEQQTEIESLKTENSNLKTKIESINYDSEIKDINNKIKSINARETYLYDKGSTGLNLNIISRYINDNLK